MYFTYVLHLFTFPGVIAIKGCARTGKHVIQFNRAWQLFRMWALKWAAESGKLLRIIKMVVLILLKRTKIRGLKYAFNPGLEPRTPPTPAYTLTNRTTMQTSFYAFLLCIYNGYTLLFKEWSLLQCLYNHLQPGSKWNQGINKSFGTK